MTKVVNMSKIVFEMLKRKAIYGLEPSFDALELQDICENVILKATQFDNTYYMPSTRDFSVICNDILEQDKFHQVIYKDNKLFLTYNWSQPTKLYDLTDIPNMVLFFMDRYITEKINNEGRKIKVPNFFEPSLGHNEINSDLSLKEKEIVTRVSAFLLREFMNKYIEYEISIGRWPKQCTDIHEFIFIKDLGKQINLEGTKERFATVYKNSLRVITDLLEENHTISISNDKFNIGAYNNFLKIIEPFSELVVYKYNIADRDSCNLNIVIEDGEVNIHQVHNRDVFAREYYEFQREQNKKQKKRVNY